MIGYRMTRLAEWGLSKSQVVARGGSTEVLKRTQIVYVHVKTHPIREGGEKARLGGSKICKDVYKRPGHEHSSRTVASIGADLCNIFYSEEKPRSKIPTHGRRTRPSSSSLFHTGRQFTLQLEGFAVPAKPLCYWWSCMRSNINSSWPYLCIY